MYTVNVIRLVLIILCLLVGSVMADGFGHESIAAFPVTIENTIWSSLYTPLSSGVIDSMKVYLDLTVASKNIMLAVYKWSDTSLIDSSEIISVGTGAAWTYFDMLLDGEVVEDTAYMLAAWAAVGDGLTNAYITFSGGAGTAADAIGSFQPWPDPWTSAGFSSGRFMSIFCYYTPPAVGPVNAIYSPGGAGQLGGPEGVSTY